MKSLKEIAEELQKKYPNITVKPARDKKIKGYIFKFKKKRVTLCSIYSKFENDFHYNVWGYAIKGGPNLLLKVKDEETEKRFKFIFANLIYLCIRLEEAR